MILSRERIDAGIDADVKNKEMRALEKMSYLINSSPAVASIVPARHCPSATRLCLREHPQVASLVLSVRLPLT
jgi:hypothetical protein